MNKNNQSEIYDPELNTWTYWSPPPVGAGDRPCLVTWRDSFILIGGSSNPRGVQLYNITANSWSTLAQMPPIPRVGHACAQLPSSNPNRFLILGGEAERQHAAIYDAGTDYWTTAAKSTSGRAYSNLSVLGNRVFAIGGHDGGKVLDTVEEYLVSQDKWEAKGVKLPGARHVQSAVTLSVDLFDSANLYTPLEEGCIGV